MDSCFSNLNYTSPLKGIFSRLGFGGARYLGGVSSSDKEIRNRLFSRNRKIQRRLQKSFFSLQGYCDRLHRRVFSISSDHGDVNREELRSELERIRKILSRNQLFLNMQEIDRVTDFSDSEKELRDCEDRCANPSLPLVVT